MRISGGNHLGIDSCIGERAEHLAATPEWEADTGSDDGNLCHVLIIISFDAEQILVVVQHIDRAAAYPALQR